jgi:hypothetical protein
MSCHFSRPFLYATTALLQLGLAASAGAEVRWTHVNAIDHVVPLGTGDFGGDGARQMVASAMVAREWHQANDYMVIEPAILLIERRDGQFFVTTVQSEENDYRFDSTAVVFADGARHKLIAVREGRATVPPPPEFAIYSGMPLSLERTFPFPREEYPDPIFVGDIDDDGTLELLYRTSRGSASGEAVVVGLENGQVEWRSGFPVGWANAAQLDGDGPLEILLGGSPFQILDGASRLVEWTHPVVGAREIVVGIFSPPPANLRIAIRNGASVHTISSHPYTHVGTHTFLNSGKISALDVNADGLDEIAVAEMFGVSNIYDPISGVDVTPPAPIFSRLGGGVVGRIGSSDQRVIALRQAERFQNRPMLAFLDGVTHDQLGALQFYSPHPVALAVGNLNGTGESNLLQINSSDRQYRSAQDLTVHDLGTGRVSSSRLDLGHKGGVPALALVQLDSDPQLEIVVAGSGSQGAALTAHDGITFQSQWSLQGQGSPFASATHIVDLVVTEGVSGSPSDVWALGYHPAQHQVVLTVLNGATGSVRWQSDPVPAGPRNSLRLMDLLGQQNRRVLLTTGNLVRTFDPADQSPSWTTSFNATVNDIDAWMEGNECRIVAALATGELEIVRCSDRSHVETIALPGEPNLVRALPGWRGFAVSTDLHVYEVSSERTRRVSTELGPRLGRQGRGVLVGGTDNPALIVGSAIATSRITMPLTIFDNGFED